MFILNFLIRLVICQLEILQRNLNNFSRDCINQRNANTIPNIDVVGFESLFLIIQLLAIIFIISKIFYIGETCATFSGKFQFLNYFFFFCFTHNEEW
jgi:hypothetical protein